MIPDGFFRLGIDPGKAVARRAMTRLALVDEGDVDAAMCQAPGDGGAQDAGADDGYFLRFLGNGHWMRLLPLRWPRLRGLASKARGDHVCPASMSSWYLSMIPKLPRIPSSS